MAFSLTFETSNAAFDDGAGGAEYSADVLRFVASKLLQGSLAGPVRDCNGNTIGSFSLNAES